MQVAGLSSAQIALRILSSGSRQDAPASGNASSLGGARLDFSGASTRTSAGVASAIQGLGSTASDASDAIANVRSWAKSGIFANAAKGVTDDTVRTLVRDGKLPTLPVLDEAQYDQLTDAEKNIYGTVSTLQGMYDWQPKSLDEALSRHVATVLESYPESITRMKAGLANGTLPAADGWPDVIKQYEAEYAAARDGRMQIMAIDDPALVSADLNYTARNDGVGWSGSGGRVEADIPALQALTGKSNVWPGASPYAGNYVIAW